jgi:hypothetical protein
MVTAPWRRVHLAGALAVLLVVSDVSCDYVAAHTSGPRSNNFGRMHSPLTRGTSLRLRGGADNPAKVAAIPVAQAGSISTDAIGATAGMGSTVKAVPLAPGGAGTVPLVKPHGRIQRTNSYSSLNEVELTGEKAGKISEDEAAETLQKIEQQVEQMAIQAAPLLKIARSAVCKPTGCCAEGRELCHLV